MIYTDMIQALIFILGGVAATYFGLEAIGGWDKVLLAIRDNAPEPETFMSLWRNKEYPWTGVLLGAPILEFGIGVPINSSYKECYLPRILLQQEGVPSLEGFKITTLIYFCNSRNYSLCFIGHRIPRTVHR